MVAGGRIAFAIVLAGIVIYLVTRERNVPETALAASGSVPANPGEAQALMCAGFGGVDRTRGSPGPLTRAVDPPLPHAPQLNAKSRQTRVS